MSWTHFYRLALRLLPAGLRHKHGPAMEALFARELGRARARGGLHGVLAGAAGIGDVLRRGAYERVRPVRGAAGEERRREAWGAWSMDAYGPQQHTDTEPGGSPMPQPTTRQILRRHAASFALAFVALTAALLALATTRYVEVLGARGAPAGALAEVLLLSVPYVVALTIPMAVLVAVLREFTRLGADGTLDAARRTFGGVRRLVLPVLAAVAGLAALTLVVTAEIVPRTNERLATVLAGGETVRSDRAMTIGELQETARNVRQELGPEGRAHAVQYEVEVQKKLALPAACVVLALAGMAIALRVRRGGAGLVIGASGAILAAYYVMLVAGETLADRLVVSPFVGMWGANALLLTAALLAVWRRRAPTAPGGRAAVLRA